MSNTLKSALISEKSFADVARSKYTFVVPKDLDKKMVAAECEKIFGVKVLSVNIMNYNGKIKTNRKGKGKRSDWKKVIVTVKTGQKIDLFEIEEKDKEKKNK